MSLINVLKIIKITNPLILISKEAEVLLEILVFQPLF